MYVICCKYGTFAKLELLSPKDVCCRRNFRRTSFVGRNRCFCSFHENIKTRSFYSACQEKYEKTPGVRVVSHDIELRRAGDSLYMKSHLVLVNEGKYPCSTFDFLFESRFESRFVVGRLSTGCFLARRTDSFDRSKIMCRG